MEWGEAALWKEFDKGDVLNSFKSVFWTYNFNKIL